MKNQSKDTSFIDERLKQLDHEITWKDHRKSKLEKEILLTMDRDHHKLKLFSGLKYILSLGVLVVLLFFIYNFVADSIIKPSEESQMGNHGHQPNNHQGINENNDQDEAPENDSNGIGANETKLEIHSGSTETLVRQVEGMDQEVKVINYQIQPYGIVYQLDEIFGVPEVTQNQIIYSYLNAEYKIRLEMIEHTNLEKAVSSLQESFENEGYEESFDLENTPVEENHLMGKMQFFGHYPVKGFIAYEVYEHVLVITFQYPAEAGDGMYPILKDLRKSLHVD